VIEPVAEAIAEPVEVMAQPEVTVAKAAKKYKTLTGVFFSGGFKGQLAAVYRDRDTCLNRMADFKLALANGDITPPEQLSKSMQAKLAALGIVL
jgi:hypothetical protein